MLCSLSIPCDHFPTPVNSFFKKYFITSYGTRCTVIHLESPLFRQIISIFFFFSLHMLWWIILCLCGYFGLFPSMEELPSPRACVFLRLLVPIAKSLQEKGTDWQPLQQRREYLGNGLACLTVYFSLARLHVLFTEATVSHCLGSLFVFLFYPFVSWFSAK